MKKIVAGLSASAMLAAGLVGTSGSAAVAEPYSGTVETFTEIFAPNKVTRGDRARICVKVTSNGNGRPEGKVALRVARAKGGFRFIDVEKYDGRMVCFRTPKLEMRGEYFVRAKFDRQPHSVWKDSDNVAEFRVVKPRRS